MGKLTVRLQKLKKIINEEISSRIKKKIMSEINYTKAFEELQEIVHEIESGEISVDTLSKKVKRAAELIKVCKTKLTSTEEDVNKILKELSAADDPEAAV